MSIHNKHQFADASYHAVKESRHWQTLSCNVRACFICDHPLGVTLHRLF